MVIEKGGEVGSILRHRTLGALRPVGLSSTDHSLISSNQLVNYKLTRVVFHADVLRSLGQLRCWRAGSPLKPLRS
uniref:Uncharacterized protein n=1 Tax=Timema shepardi TaxID=629360 RepID=A0A7R9ANQ7_TIMSH|nr:unnamed protein product [Timema shepardi]